MSTVLGTVTYVSCMRFQISDFYYRKKNLNHHIKDPTWWNRAVRWWRHPIKGAPRGSERIARRNGRALKGPHKYRTPQAGVLESRVREREARDTRRRESVCRARHGLGRPGIGASGGNTA